MMKNHQNKVDFHEIIRVYFEAEESLIEKLQQTNNDMMKLINEREYLKESLENNEERYNSKGLSEKSKLSIQLLNIYLPIDFQEEEYFLAINFENETKITHQFRSSQNMIELEENFNLYKLLFF